MIIGCLIELGGKSGCGRGGGRLECEIGGSEKVKMSRANGILVRLDVKSVCRHWK